MVSYRLASRRLGFALWIAGTTFALGVAGSCGTHEADRPSSTGDSSSTRRPSPPLPASTAGTRGTPIPSTSARPIPRTSVPPTPTLTDPADKDLLDRQRQLVMNGQVAYRAPTPMRVNDVQRVTVRIAGQVAPPEFTSSLPGSGKVTVEQVRVGSNLTADLSSADFQITRVGGDDGRRTLAADSFAEWAWDVRPLRSGTRHLDLVVYVRLTDGSAPIYYKTFDHSVEVEVDILFSFSRWLKDYGALTGLTIPVLAAAAWKLVRHLRLAKSEKATPSKHIATPPAEGNPRPD
jgi:hypothetical protein